MLNPAAHPGVAAVHGLQLFSTLRRNEPAGVKILKTLCIANCMKYLYAGLQNELPTQPGPFDRNYVPNGCDHGSNSDTVARSRRSTSQVKPAQCRRKGKSRK
jgi:hypothetical protein